VKLAGAGAQKGLSLSAVWASNDEVNHRIAFVELPDLVVDPDKQFPKAPEPRCRMARYTPISPIRTTI
jgi:hypothetical protein